MSIVVERLINTPQQNDSGSEAAIGFDFQQHIATGKCISMLQTNNINLVICEFHEDLVEVRKDGAKLDLYQIKKKESGNWSLNELLKPPKKQTKGILGKLCEKVQLGKDIRSISLVGYGRCSGDEEFSLPELIQLLITPEVAKDLDWKAKIDKYIDHLATELKSQNITSETVAKSVSILKIDFTYPHPEAIEAKNIEKLEEVLRVNFDVELNMSEVKEIYRDLFERIKNISIKPKQSWNVKSITREEASEIIYKRLRNYRPLANREQYQTLQEKLSSAQLEEKVIYARECRINALILKYEVNIQSKQWKRFKAEINSEWQKFRKHNPNIKGAELWKNCLDVFDKLGLNWILTDERLNSDFVEGVFFDMSAICEVKWKG